MPAYYNELDPYAAQWLRNLIAADLIAPGDVDERSISDVRPDDLAGYTQCHFFAGIGVWSHALRSAGWPDDREVWTGSCPCQPFSNAGCGRGTDDPRHLWPDFFRLIEKRRPAIVFGEQVASKSGLAWLDIVQADLEGADYAVGSVDTCAAGFGAPHIRQRLYFVADADLHGARRATRAEAGPPCPTARASGGERQERAGASDLARRGGSLRNVDDAKQPGLQRFAGHGHDQAGRQESAGPTAATVVPGKLADTRSHGHSLCAQLERETDAAVGTEGAQRDHDDGCCGSSDPGPTNGLWRDADWLYCRDGKWRAVEPGTFPLAHGIAARVGRLRAYGNAVNAEQAHGFIAAYMEVRP